jgi:hypothetical protein
LISTYGGIQTTSMSTAGYSIVDVAVFVDGVIPNDGAYARLNALNNTGLTSTFDYWTFVTAPVLSAGTHTITVRASAPPTPLSSVNATVGGNNTSVLQGELNVAIIKQ